MRKDLSSWWTGTASVLRSWSRRLRQIAADRSRRLRWAVAGMILVAAGLSLWSVLIPWTGTEALRGDTAGLSGLSLSQLRREGADGGAVETAAEQADRAHARVSADPGSASSRAAAPPVGQRVNPAELPAAPRPEPLDLPADRPGGTPADRQRGLPHGGDGSQTGGEAAEAAAAEQEAEAAPVAVDVRTMQLPVQGPLVRDRGWYRHPIYSDWRYYPGVELQIQPGTVVTASLPGTVVFTGEDERWGLVVRLDHGNGWETLYGYLSEIQVQEGERVRAGAPLGKSGTSPVGEPHLFFSVWHHDQPVDPERFLEFQGY